jgi:hypothetical protein
VGTSLFLQGLLQFYLKLNFPHGLTNACWLLKDSSTCLQDFFSWIHGFRDSLLGFVASRLLHLASWLQYSNNIKAYLLGFMASRLLYLASWFQVFFTWLHGFNTQTISLFHCHFHQINDNIFSIIASRNKHSSNHNDNMDPKDDTFIILKTMFTCLFEGKPSKSIA